RRTRGNNARSPSRSRDNALAYACPPSPFPSRTTTSNTGEPCSMRRTSSLGVRDFPEPLQSRGSQSAMTERTAHGRPLHVRKFFTLLLLLSAAAALGAWRLLLLLRPAALGG